MPSSRNLGVSSPMRQRSPAKVSRNNAKSSNAADRTPPAAVPLLRNSRERLAAGDLAPSDVLPLMGHEAASSAAKFSKSSDSRGGWHRAAASSSTIGKGSSISQAWLWWGVLLCVSIAGLMRWQGRASSPSTDSPIIGSGAASTSQIARLHSQVHALQDELSKVVRSVDGVVKMGQANTKQTENLVQSINSLETLLLEHRAKVDADIRALETRNSLVVRKQLNEVLDSEIGARVASELKESIIAAKAAADTTPPHAAAPAPPQSGKIDWARAAMGATVDTVHTSRPLNSDTWNSFVRAVVRRWIPQHKYQAKPMSKPADVIIGGPEAAAAGLLVGEDSLLPGHCFAFAGASGNVTLLLPTIVRVDEIEIEHISQTVTPDPSSAPRSLSVYVDDCRNGDAYCWHKFLKRAPLTLAGGPFTFKYPEMSRESFKLTDAFPTRRVRIEVLENRGNRDYTCVYRIRVHGEAQQKGGAQKREAEQP